MSKCSFVCGESKCKPATVTIPAKSEAQSKICFHKEISQCQNHPGRCLVNGSLKTVLLLMVHGHLPYYCTQVCLSYFYSLVTPCNESLLLMGVTCSLSRASRVTSFSSSDVSLSVYSSYLVGKRND